MTVVSITIRNRDADVKTRLWMRAADNVRSMEGNTWLILRDTVERKRDFSEPHEHITCIFIDAAVVTARLFRVVTIY